METTSGPAPDTFGYATSPKAANAAAMSSIRMEVDRPHHMVTEFDRLAVLVEAAHDRFGELMGRLESVRVGREGVMASPQDPEPPRSEWAGRLAYQADQVNSLILRIETVIDELDL